MVRIQKREKFILQGNLQGLGKKCSILAAVYLFITGNLVSAASAGKRDDSTVTGVYEIGINNAVICGKLNVLGGAIAIADRGQISLTDVGGIQYQRGISYGICPRGFRNQNLQRGKNGRLFRRTEITAAAASRY